MIEYRALAEGEQEAARRFLADLGWADRVADPERFARMVAGAHTVAAWEGQRLVGFARALCDDASNGYLSTVAVAEDCRGKGIGRELVERLMGSDPGITWVLRAGRGSEPFWEKMGFQRSAVAMERTRRGPGV